MKKTNKHNIEQEAMKAIFGGDSSNCTANTATIDINDNVMMDGDDSYAGECSDGVPPPNNK